MSILNNRKAQEESKIQWSKLPEQVSLNNLRNHYIVAHRLYLF